MHSPTLLLVLTTALASLALAAQPERTVSIHAWPLSAPHSQPLAEIAYTATNATVTSSTAPAIPDGDDIVRVGFHRPAPAGWSGGATAATNLAPGRRGRVLLHVDAKGELFHVGFVAGEGVSEGSSGEGVLGAEVVRVQRGPTPHLNKPVVLDAEGQLPQKEVEKSFLQKYWWVIAGFLLLQVVLGGSKE